MKVLFVDVRKAHLNAVCEEEVWVELPSEFWEWGRFARLRRWLYGMRKAASGWEDDYARRLEGCGFRRGVGAPTVFWNKATGVRVVVHGDDFTFAGVRKELDRMKNEMENWYDVKLRGIMGSGEGETREMTILGRTVRWTTEGLEYWADDKHRDILMRSEGLREDSKLVTCPVSRSEEKEEEGDEVELKGEDAKEYRALGARLNYLGQDRSDIPVCH